jgi:hypothetical protein
VLGLVGVGARLSSVSVALFYRALALLPSLGRGPPGPSAEKGGQPSKPWLLRRGWWSAQEG